MRFKLKGMQCTCGIQLSSNSAVTSRDFHQNVGRELTPGGKVEAAQRNQHHQIGQEPEAAT